MNAWAFGALIGLGCLGQLAWPVSLQPPLRLKHRQLLQATDVISDHGWVTETRVVQEEAGISRRVHDEPLEAHVGGCDQHARAKVSTTVELVYRNFELMQLFVGIDRETIHDMMIAEELHGLNSKWNKQNISKACNQMRPVGVTKCFSPGGTHVYTTGLLKMIIALSPHIQMTK